MLSREPHASTARAIQGTVLSFPCCLLSAPVPGVDGWWMEGEAGGPGRPAGLHAWADMAPKGRRLHPYQQGQETALLMSSLVLLLRVWGPHALSMPRTRWVGPAGLEGKPQALGGRTTAGPL